MIDRVEYLEELKRWKDKDLIKVVTGIRRCGKSTLFELFINYLKEINITDEQIIKINLEDADYNFEGYKELYNCESISLFRQPPPFKTYCFSWRQGRTRR